MKRNPMRPWYLVIVVLVFAHTETRAQGLESGISPSLSGASQAAYYYLSKPGEITMQVNLWGNVKNPGRYEIPISTDMVQLISFAGGPLPEADLATVRIIRIAREGGSKKVQFSINLNHIDQIDEQSLSLHPGDTIFIDRISFTFESFVGILTTAATVAIAVASVINVTK
jgi:SLBB domain